MIEDLKADRLMTPEEASEVVGLSAKYLATLRRLGGGPRYFKLGTGPKSACRYRPSDLRAWIEERITEGGPK